DRTDVPERRRLRAGLQRDLRQRRPRRDGRRRAVHMESRRAALQPEDRFSRQRVRTEPRARRWRRPRRRDSGRGASAQRSTQHLVEGGARRASQCRREARADVAAAFDDLTRSKGIDQLTEQGPGAWPNTFRTSRFIPAVEYIRAQRARTLLNRQMEALMSKYDVF